MFDGNMPCVPVVLQVVANECSLWSATGGPLLFRSFLPVNVIQGTSFGLLVVVCPLSVAVCGVVV